MGEGYLRIQIDGEWSRSNPEDIINDIRNLTVQHDCPALLIDIRNMVSTESVVDDYYDAKLFEGAGFQQFERIAVLDNLNRHEANDFFETTAANRELQFYFFYTEEQDAMNWLLPGGQDQT